VRRAHAAVLAVAIVVGLGAAFVLTRPDRDGDEPRAAPTSASAPEAERFLSTYVEADGRVVRRDQGGDTVSEGQAYALLLAASLGDRARFDRVWAWTQENLQRDDGLFAWRWQDRRVVDENPAPDADVDIAVALAIAAERFGDDSLRDEARRVAAAVLDHETATVDGEPVLVAGPWAVEDRVVNPSYGARCDYGALARATGDERWLAVGDASAAMLATLVDAGLPPDWAVVDDRGDPRPVAAPDRQDGPGRYGLDAARIPARLSGCPEGRELAARMWDRLSALDGDGAAVAYSLDGEPLAGDRHPVGLIGAAGAARAAGDDDEAGRLFAEAAGLEREHPTYYGAAWLALGEVLLDLHAGQLAGAGGREVVVLVQTQPTETQTQPSETTTTVTDTTAPTTAPPPTAPETTSGTSPTTTPPGTTGTTTAGGGGTTPSTTRPGEPSSTTTTGPPDEAGDLSSPASDPGEQLSSDPEAEASSPGEPARRRTGAIALAGLAGTAALGVALGLRERAHLILAARRDPT
jgi:endoglucanase